MTYEVKLRPIFNYNRPLINPLKQGYKNRTESNTLSIGWVPYPGLNNRAVLRGGNTGIEEN
jgi:hypothetical protein